MKIVIEDYYGNDICSFKVNTFANGSGVDDVGDFKDCNYADMDNDDNGELYIRIQLDNENFKLYN